MLKLKIETSLFILFLGLAAAPLQAQARNCELPHEQIQLKCGGDSPNTYDPETYLAVNRASGVQKTRPAGDMLKEYRARSAAFSALVQKADNDYQTYLNSKVR